MDWTVAEALAELSARAYDRDPALALGGRAERVDAFRTRTFSGFVLSLDGAVVIVFRGTEPSDLNQVMADLKFPQIAWHGGLVHQGFFEELYSAWPQIRGLLLLHGAMARPCYVTGHSAGGAMATLAAQYLALEGVPIRAAYVYCSPRVGDPMFAAHYGVPLYRFEYGDDLMPHLPFAPALKNLAQVAVQPLLALLMPIFPNVVFLQPAAWVYTHVGKVYYFDEDGNVQHNADLVSTAATVIGELFAKKKPSGPRLVPVPGNMLYASRLPIMIKNFSRDRTGIRSRIARHHGIDTMQRAIRGFRRGTPLLEP